MQHAIEKVNGVVEVKNGIVLAGDALNIEVDRVKAALEGMDPDSITTMLDDYLSGNVTTDIQKGPKLVGVRVWLPERRGRRCATSATFCSARRTAIFFRLKRVAKLVPVTGQPEIERDDLKRMVAVTGADQRARPRLDRAGNQNQVLDKNGFLPNVRPILVRRTLRAAADRFQRPHDRPHRRDRARLHCSSCFSTKVSASPSPCSLMPLLAVAAVYLGLWLTGTEFNITSRMGMTMIVGIVTEVAIFYYSEFRELEPSDDDRLDSSRGHQPSAPDCDDHLRRHPRAPAARARDRPGLRHATTARHRHHRRSVFGIPLTLIVLPRVTFTLRNPRAPSRPIAGSDPLRGIRRIEERHETEIHVELLVAMEQR